MAQRTRLSFYWQKSGTSLPDATYKTNQVNLNTSYRPKYHTGPLTISGFGHVSRRQPVNLGSGDIMGDFSVVSIVAPGKNSYYYGLYDWVLDVADPTRDYRVQSYSSPGAGLFSQDSNVTPETKGIGINMAPEGNDIVIPQGKGQVSWSGAHGFDPFGYGNTEDFNIDKGFTWVKVNDGTDAVIGGQGQDMFVSDIPSVESSYKIFKAKFAGASSLAKGSKFFVGGSYDDFLSGGSSPDLLVGDRFNASELYLNKEALASNVPESFGSLKQRLLSYQPDHWQGNTQTPVDNTHEKIYVGYGARIDHERNNKDLTNELWVPGNDVIHGFDGNDVIYGDNNFSDNYIMLKMLKQKNWMGRSRIGDDFIDAGRGNDIIFAGVGSDAIIGGAGSDFISCGDQITADGYTPLFGPKVVWGGEYNKSSVSAEPDLFLIGDTYHRESQIDNSIKGFEDYQARLDKISSDSKSQLNILSNAWNGIKFVADFIPGGSTLTGVIDALINSASDFTTQRDYESTSQAPSNKFDFVTIIKDFDKSDIVIFKNTSGSSISADAKSSTYTTAAYQAINPLITSNVTPYSGTLLSFGGNSSTSFERVVLDGYKDKLFLLGTVTASDNQSTYTALGGSAFGSITAKSNTGVVSPAFNVFDVN